MNVNGFRELTPEIKFGRGLPHINHLPQKIKCVDIDKKTFIFHQRLNAICKKIDYAKTMRILRPI